MRAGGQSMRAVTVKAVTVRACVTESAPSFEAKCGYLLRDQAHQEDDY